MIFFHPTFIQNKTFFLECYYIQHCQFIQNQNPIILQVIALTQLIKYSFWFLFIPTRIKQIQTAKYQALFIIIPIIIFFKVQHMYNKEFLKYERLKSELENIKTLCADQYFAVSKCQGGQGPNMQGKCGKMHVDRCYYPCIHFYMGNCKYGFNCLFSHSIKRQIVKPEPPKEVCRKLYYENYCPQGNKCRFSHDLRTQACIYNSLGKCKFSAEMCRFSHDKKVDVSVPCFFNLMGGCKNEQCQNKHTFDNIIKYISYEGPI